MSSMGQLMAPGAGESAGFNEGVAHLPSVPAQRFNAEEAVRALQGLGEGLNAARVVREELKSLTMSERLPAWTRGVSTLFTTAVVRVLAPLEEPVVGLLSEVKNALSACRVALPDKDSGLSRWTPLPSELPEGFASAVDTFKARLQSEPGALLEASRKVHALFNPFEVTAERVQNTYTVGCSDAALSGAAQPAVREIVELQFRIGKAQLSRLVDDVSNPHREVEEVSASSGAAQASNGKSGGMCVEWSFTSLAVGLRDAGRTLESTHAQHRLVFFSRCTQTFADAAEKIAFFVRSDCERVFSSSGTPDQPAEHFQRLTEMVGRYRNAVARYTQRLDAFALQTPEMANGVQPSDAEVSDSDIRINGEIQDILRPELNPRESFGRGSYR